MRSPTNQTTYAPARRILAAAGIVLFVAVFFALPLHAALMLCTMPCCDHDSGTGGPVVSADMTACATECVIRTDNATAASAPIIAPEKPTHERIVVMAVAAATVDLRTATAAADRATIDGSRVGASLHVLNSVLRI